VRKLIKATHVPFATSLAAHPLRPYIKNVHETYMSTLIGGVSLSFESVFLRLRAALFLTRDVFTKGASIRCVAITGACELLTVSFDKEGKQAFLLSAEEVGIARCFSIFLL
jgi:hypothetical protein